MTANFVTGTIGAPANSTATQITWHDNEAGILDVPASLAAGDDALELDRIDISAPVVGFGFVFIQIKTSTVDSDTDAAGPDLSSAWEQFAGAIVLEAGTLSLTLPGPDYTGATTRDASEPYSYQFNDLALADRIRAFITGYNALSAALKNATTVTLTDDVLGIRIAGRLPVAGLGSSDLAVAHRVRGRLSIAGTGNSDLDVGHRISGRLPIAGTGASDLDVGHRVRGRLEITGTGSSDVLVARPVPVRLSGSLQIAGTGSSDLGVIQPGRLSGRLPIAGLGSSDLGVRYRVGRRLRIRGLGSSDLGVRYQVAGRLPIAGTGSSGIDVGHRVAGRLPLAGVGRSDLDVANPPLRITGRLEIAGFGSSDILVARATPLRIAGRLQLRGLGASDIDVGNPVTWDETIRASSPTSAIITAVEIMHPEASAPLRLVDATENRTIEGGTYVATRIRSRLANDDENRPPRAEIFVDNIGERATDWIEEAGGAAGATVRMMQLLDHDGAAIEWEMTLDVERLYTENEAIVARLGFDSGLGRPAVLMRHDPATTPGIF